MHYSWHRSHFGSRYKLGCCGHAGLFWYMAQFFRGDTNIDQKAQLCEFCNTEDYCTLFWPTVLPLQVVPGFACSVASLNQSPGHQLPGCHSLRRGTLAGYLLGQGMPSTQVAGLMLLPHTPLPSSEATRVLKPPATNKGHAGMHCHLKFNPT